MSLMPVFPIRLILLAIPVLIVGALLAAAAGRGLGMLKKQGVAWAVTGLMIACAIGIGYAKAPANSPVPDPAPASTAAPTASQSQAPAQPVQPAPSSSYVWDNARVLSGQTVRELDERNERLWEYCSATIGVVTCNYGGDDLYDYAMQCAEDMGLGGYDMIVVLDIQGDNYWLLQGNDIRRDFTDNDCSNYANGCMEDNFVRGNYDGAVLSLTEALEDWYGDYYR